MGGIVQMRRARPPLPASLPHLRAVHKHRVAPGKTRVDRAEGAGQHTREVCRLDVEEPEDFDPATLPQCGYGVGWELALGSAVHDGTHAPRRERGSIARVVKGPQEECRAVRRLGREDYAG